MNAVAEFESQGVLQPGEPGWWKLWGARPADIRSGDLVLVKDESGEVETLYVEETFRAKAHPIRVGIVVDGERSTLGALCSIVLVRRGTRNELAK